MLNIFPFPCFVYAETKKVGRHRHPFCLHNGRHLWILVASAKSQVMQLNQADFAGS